MTVTVSVFVAVSLPLMTGTSELEVNGPAGTVTVWNCVLVTTCPAPTYCVYVETEVWNTVAVNVAVVLTKLVLVTIPQAPTYDVYVDVNVRRSVIVRRIVSAEG